MLTFNISTSCRQEACEKEARKRAAEKYANGVKEDYTSKEAGKPRAEPVVLQSSLVDFQDRIILLATKEQGIGRLIVDKVCADAVARRVVEAFHRQNKSVDEAIQGLKDLYASA
jgi:hypothetical protein